MRLAIVEDQDDIAQIMQIQLEYADVGIDTAIVLGTVRAALGWTGWPDIDAATVDWMLPDGHGTQVARWLADTHPHVHVVMVTAAPTSLRLDHPDWPTQVVGKPYDLTELLSALGVQP